MSAKHLLLVDNHDLFASFRELLVEVGRILGFQVEHLTDAKTAFEPLMARKYTLGIVDPALMSASVCKETSTPLIALTLVDDPSERKRLLQRGYQGVIERHYSREEIAFVINNVIHKEYVGQRSFPRVVAGVRSEAEMGEEKFVGELINISEGGAFFKSYRVLERNKEIQLRFNLPQEEKRSQGNGYETTVECTAQVVYSNPFVPGGKKLWPGMGLIFNNLSAETRHQISNFVRGRL